MFMVDVWLPYGKTDVCARIPTRNFLGPIEPDKRPCVPDARSEIERALREPIASKTLKEIVRPEHDVVIVADDATRPAPSSLMIPPLLEELSGAGVRKENITIIFGCGTHRPVTDEEAARLLGDEVATQLRIVSHDCRAQDLVYAGRTDKHRTEVYLNRIFSEADIKILTGDICFHYFAGYGGGRKSVLPGISGEETIKHNHKLLLHPDARKGVLEGNPVNEDMVEAANLAGVDFILNVVTNHNGELVRAYAGDLDGAFREGRKLVDEIYRRAADQKADIVVVSPGGHPSDINLFQAYKAVDNALEVVKRGGAIVLAAECPDGHGNQVFYDWMAKFKDLESIQKAIQRDFVLGSHKAYYLMRALRKAQIILVSSMPEYYAQNAFKLKTARAVNDALDEAFNITSKKAKVWAIPYGSSTLPQVSQSSD